MATDREDELEYESDPEESKGSLVMRRRRAASDDEEERGGGGGERDGREGEGVSDVEGERMNRTVRIRSDEYEGEGGAADYDEEEEDEEDGLDGEEAAGGYDEEEEEEVVDDVVVVDDVLVEGRESGETDDRVGATGMVREWAEDQEKEVESEVEKKENEPYAVPTTGAFYMHDDRFRDNVGGRNRYSQFGFELFV